MKKDHSTISVQIPTKEKKALSALLNRYGVNMTEFVRTVAEQAVKEGGALPTYDRTITYHNMTKGKVSKSFTTVDQAMKALLK